MGTASESKRSFWEVSTPEWCPEGTFALSVSGNADGREVAKEWALMIRECDKRDGNSAWVVAARTMNRKGGIWTFEAVEGSSTVGALKYVGNRDGRPDAIGWYLAVHDSNEKDWRDKSSSYVIATKEAATATLWERKEVNARPRAVACAVQKLGDNGRADVASLLKPHPLLLLLLLLTLLLLLLLSLPLSLTPLLSLSLSQPLPLPLILCEDRSRGFC